ncbi:MAG: MaoC family dehydratase N-terminal domain-containing protein [Anaeromyxobacter sp.]|nr:MaoC family dehydratase N-terminal domain-containing protein [Anaeromyxobacter sp.]MBL0275512.1 MaoC family dehydratase N-terminal domain-containing protein [Anaeromyxobacter sp.]
MTITARQLYFEAVKVGDELPPLVKPPVDRLQVARYVGAAQDWNPLYIDEPHARTAGFPSAFAPGMLGMGFLGELATDWVRGARLRRFQSRFVKIVWPNDVLTVRGRVSDRRFEPGGAYGIDIEVWAENQRGELVTRGLATFQLYYSAEDEARQRAGQPPLVTTLEEEEARLARLSRAQPPRPVVPPRPMQPARPLAAPPPPAPPKAPGQASALRLVPPPQARPAVPPRPPAPPARPAPTAAKVPPARPAAQKAAPPKPSAPPKKGSPAKAPPRPAKVAARQAPARPAAATRKPPPKKPAKAPPRASRPTTKKAGGKKK